MRVLIDENLTHKDPSLTVSFDWPAADGIAKVTVTNPVHMLTFVGMTFFGTTFPITVQNAFFANCPEILVMEHQSMDSAWQEHLETSVSLCDSKECSR